MARRTKCRQCGAVFTYESIKAWPHYPFCSSRCKLLDLGQWFDEEHRIDERMPDAGEKDE